MHSNLLDRLLNGRAAFRIHDNGRINRVARFDGRIALQHQLQVALLQLLSQSTLRQGCCGRQSVSDGSRRGKGGHGRLSNAKHAVQRPGDRWSLKWEGELKGIEAGHTCDPSRGVGMPGQHQDQERAKKSRTSSLASSRLIFERELRNEECVTFSHSPEKDPIHRILFPYRVLSWHHYCAARIWWDNTNSRSDDHSSRETRFALSFHTGSCSILCIEVRSGCWKGNRTRN